ncbi:MAG: hypothetical protein WBE58_00920 [Verrucomicrobiales bacterium]|nr:hypothetical protein [Verrucomicrobiales bacterium]
MRIIAISVLACFLLSLPAGRAQQDGTPPAATAASTTEPFGAVREIPTHSLELDRNRGAIKLNASDGSYADGSHFGNWRWTLKAKRWGRYAVRVHYTLTRTEIGMQVRIGDAAMLKGYASRTRDNVDSHAAELGYAYIPAAGEYPLTLLTGDRSNGEGFSIKSVELVPGPESDFSGPNIDGTIELLAKHATTYSEAMRYEPKTEKNCLGFWTNPDDWAEWTFKLHGPGKYKIELIQGCGTGSGGSEVALLSGKDTLNFKVEETGGFQNWKKRDLGVIEFADAGDHRIALKPLKKSGNAVMDVQQILLTPVD